MYRALVQVEFVVVTYLHGSGILDEDLLCGCEAIALLEELFEQPHLFGEPALFSFTERLDDHVVALVLRSFLHHGQQDFGVVDLVFGLNATAPHLSLGDELTRH